MNEIDNDLDLGKRLAALRKKNGYTQTELAEMIGISRKMIADYEQGRIRISATLLAKMADVLKFSTDKILSLKPMPEIEEAVDLRYMKRLRYMKQIPKENQQTLFMLIDNYLRKIGVDIPKTKRSSGEEEEEKM